ncbi:MAG: putative bifunctional diguanylate cyclase/phosphodiesterase, partial [Burkholderiales bacterium]
VLIAALTARAAWRLSGALRSLRHREQELRESDELFREFAANIPQVSWIREVGSDGILYASPVWKQITGREPARAVGELLDYIHPDDRQRVAEAMRANPRGGFDCEFRIVRPDRSERWLRGRTFPIRDPSGTVYRVTGIGDDITQYKEAQERLLQITRYDHLTDLPNRRFFYESLSKILSHGRDSQAVVGILSIDLDRFKVVNDSLGHTAGDDLLRQAGTRLLSCVRTRDIVGRLGGDEFAIALAQLPRLDDAQLVAGKVLDALSKPFLLEGRDVYMSGSIGITIYPTDSTDLDELLRFADAAMYRAKEDGRNTFRYYTAQMNARVAERLELETGLREALDKNEFELRYQPKLDLRSGAISGAEALIRWNRGDAGMVSPAEFIPLLEETGLIVPVGEWVIREASRQIKAWQTEGLKPISVAVNLSGRQFQEKNLAPTVTRVMREQGVDPGLLHCEITESLLMSHVEQAIATLKSLQSAGAQIAVDDFGTGYSSLAYLKRFPIDALKIDQSFVRDVTTNADDAAIAI